MGMGWGLRRGEHRQRAAVTVPRPDPLAAEVARTCARLDAHDAKLAALFRSMGDACQAAGLPAPDKEETVPMLRLVKRDAVG